MGRKLLSVIAIVVLAAVACGGSDVNPAVFGGEGDKGEQKKTRAPSHDNFSRAQELSGLPAEVATNTAAATLEANEPQPSCGQIDKTVWYRFTTSEELNLVATATAEFDSIIGVYRAGEGTTLIEVGCGGPLTDNEVAFAAAEGDTHYIQLGGMPGTGGAIEFGLRQASKAALLLGKPDPLAPGWVEKVLVEQQEVTVPATGPVDLPLLTIDGRQRASDPDFYDISIKAAGQQLQTIGLNTGGMLRQPIHYELVKLSKEESKVKVKLFYRYDPSQARCQLDIGGKCTVRLPVNVTKHAWTTERGPSAELIVQAGVKGGKIDANGQQADLVYVDPLFVRIPLLGQVLALQP